jgi:hypothetical protein
MKCSAKAGLREHRGKSPRCLTQIRKLLRGAEQRSPFRFCSLSDSMESDVSGMLCGRLIWTARENQNETADLSTALRSGRDDNSVAKKR